MDRLNMPELIAAYEKNTLALFCWAGIDQTKASI